MHIAARELARAAVRKEGHLEKDITSMLSRLNIYNTEHTALVWCEKEYKGLLHMQEKWVVRYTEKFPSNNHVGVTLWSFIPTSSSTATTTGLPSQPPLPKTQQWRAQRTTGRSPRRIKSYFLIRFQQFNEHSRCKTSSQKANRRRLSHHKSLFINMLQSTSK